MKIISGNICDFYQTPVNFDKLFGNFEHNFPVHSNDTAAFKITPFSVPRFYPVV
jgi:hypothetical protein